MFTIEAGHFETRNFQFGTFQNWSTGCSKSNKNTEKIIFWQFHSWFWEVSERPVSVSKCLFQWLWFQNGTVLVCISFEGCERPSFFFWKSFKSSKMKLCGRTAKNKWAFPWDNTFSFQTFNLKIKINLKIKRQIDFATRKKWIELRRSCSLSLRQKLV